MDHKIKEERPLQPIRKIVGKGSVDVIFRRSDKPMLIVVGETAEAVASVKTYYKGSKLVIEREGIVINIASGRGRMVFHGSVTSFSTNGAAIGIRQDKVIVCVALPEAPTIKIKGSGDISLFDVQQVNLELAIEGSGDIVACGTVTHLDVYVAGSGDVDVGDLKTENAALSIAGSGDIEAFVHKDVRARVAGSGSIVVRGNPPLRDYSVAGSGKIKFR
ncbi:Putative auto-transporter adhesin, head GIN domain (plasmid) [Janthinobacterium sp. HH102]|nr:Putative auto-transporter adhesin, head GIN domain [Janthinobacterium sp. HH102]